jgi:menaquinone-dependent protoporphyrinogen IX oxidase
VKALILYKSKYGSTKQYAQWLNQEINSDIFELDKCPSLENYNLIILGGGIYMGKINGSDFISKNWDILKNKKVILFSTSGAEPGTPEIQNFYKNSLPQEIRSQIRYFPLSGACVYKDLTFLHKILSFIGSLFQKNPQKKYEMRHGFNRVKKDNINPILDYIKALLMSNISIS